MNGNWETDGLAGANDLMGTAQTKADDAQRPRPVYLDEGRWPSIRTVLRIVALAFVALVVAGWILTALNG